MSLPKPITWGDDPSFFGPRDYFRNTLILRELASLKQGAHILDYGCGCGNLTRRLILRGFKVTAFDVSLLSLQVCRKNIKHLHQEETTRITSESSEILGPFDAVCCGEVLEHLEHDAETIRLFHIVLKPGGLCVITVPAHQRYWDENDTLSGHRRRYEKNEISQMMRDAGFHVKKVLCFGPVSLAWHRRVYLPVIKKRRRTIQILHHTNNTQLRIQHYLARIFSLVFFFDLLFMKSDAWNAYLLVAKKS